MTKSEYMQLYNIDSEYELYKQGTITINGYDFFPSEISSYGNTNTKTYSVTPERAEDFTMETINEIPTAEIPRLQFNFDIMSLDVWRRLKIATKPNEFLCTFYDWEYDKIVTHKMYFATQDDIDIFVQFGAKQDYYVATKKTVSIVATMNGLTEVSVTYNPNGVVVANNKEISIYPNELFHIDNGYDFGILSTTKRIRNWNTKSDGSGTQYNLGMSMTINQDLELYAIWENI